MKDLGNQGRKPKKWQRKRKERKGKLKREINGWIYEGNGEAILEKMGNKIKLKIQDGGKESKVVEQDARSYGKA